MLGVWADLIDSRRAELAELEISDVGHLRQDALGDLATCLRIIRHYAGVADKIEGRTYSQFPDRIAYGFAEPYGVVEAITPFNANAVMVALRLAPALVAGNYLAHTAPEVAPLLTYALARLALEAGIPPGGVNVVTGRGHVIGPRITQHPGIGMVSFTRERGGGSLGHRAVGTQHRPRRPRLGGKNAVILLPDADLSIAVRSTLHSNSSRASGQSCVAGSRILAHASIYDEVCSRGGSMQVGLPTDDGTQMSTLVTKKQRDRVHALVGNAVSHGATCLARVHPAQGRRCGTSRPSTLCPTPDGRKASTGLRHPSLTNWRKILQLPSCRSPTGVKQAGHCSPTIPMDGRPDGRQREPRVDTRSRDA